MRVNNNLHSIIVKEYSNPDSTKSLTDIAREYSITRQRVHQILKKYLTLDELGKLKKQKALIRHADILNKERIRRKVQNRINIIIRDINTVFSNSLGVEFNRIIINGKPTQIFYSDKINKYIVIQNASSHSKEKAGFLLNETEIKYKSVIINNRNMKNYFNKLECAYLI